MIEHLEVRVHIASIALVDKPIVVGCAIHLLLEVQDDEDVRVYFLRLNLLNFTVGTI